MLKIRLFLILTTILVVATFGYAASLYARGYRFDLKTLRFAPNGILVVKSEPSGAQIYVNGDLRTATDASLSLSPGTYDVSLKKEGFLGWYKRLTIEKEVVTEANVALFKSAPSLAPVTFTGAEKPIISEDGGKIAYAVLPSTSAEVNSKAGLWLIEALNLPLGFSRDPRRVTDGDISDASWEFSPSGREILLTTKGGVFLLDVGTYTPQNQRVNVASKKETILAGWEKEKKTRLEAQIKALPDEMKDLLTRKVSAVILSPDEQKIIYTASGSATLSNNLIKALPGSSTQTQEREIKDSQTYVYDIKEDRNFLVYSEKIALNHLQKSDNSFTNNMRWFPNSRNIVLAESGKITILDYDGTNRQTVYSGNYVTPFAFPFANTEKLIILTNLGASSLPNLYSLSLK